MTLAQLIAQFRTDACDAVAPYLFSDAAVTQWLNEAEAEAAIRARLLHESASVSICQIPVLANASVYPLHAALHEIDYLAFAPTGNARRHPVKLTSREALDDVHHDWRERTGRPEYAIQSDASIRLAFTPDTPGTLLLEGFRLPLTPMTSPADTPEINAAHHRHLVHWALHRALSVPDAETIDPTRAALAETAFTRYFGIRPGADLRRSARQDTIHHNPAFWA